LGNFAEHTVDPHAKTGTEVVYLFEYYITYISSDILLFSDTSDIVFGNFEIKRL